MRQQSSGIRAATRACLGILVAGAAASAAAALAEGPVRFAKQPSPDPNQFIVVFEKGSDVPAMMKKMEAWSGATAMKQYDVVLPGGVFAMTESEARLAAKMPGVAFIEQNQRVEPAREVNIAAPVDYGLDNLTAAQGYRSKFDGTGVTIYVEDSGITAHNDLPAIRVLADLVGDGKNGADCAGHGTRVAGLVVGKETGAAQGAKLVSMRIFPCDGGTTNDILIQGFDMVAKDAAQNPGPSILQGSLSGDASDASDMAITTLVQSGVTAVISAGNEGRDACLASPGRAPAAISVGAVDNSSVLAVFSNTGPCVTVYSSGVAVQSTSAFDPNALEFSSGTSFSAPLVAGVAALVIQKGIAETGKQPTPAEVKQSIIALATRGQIRGLPTPENNLIARVP